MSAGPTIEAAIRAQQLANETKKNSDEVTANTSAYVEGAKTSADEAKLSALDVLDKLLLINFVRGFKYRQAKPVA